MTMHWQEHPQLQEPRRLIRIDDLRWEMERAIARDDAKRAADHGKAARVRTVGRTRRNTRRAG